MVHMVVSGGSPMAIIRAAAGTGTLRCALWAVRHTHRDRRGQLRRLRRRRAPALLQAVHQRSSAVCSAPCRRWRRYRLRRAPRSAARAAVPCPRPWAGRPLGSCQRRRRMRLHWALLLLPGCRWPRRRQHQRRASGCVEPAAHVELNDARSHLKSTPGAQSRAAASWHRSVGAGVFPPVAGRPLVAGHAIAAAGLGPGRPRAAPWAAPPAHRQAAGGCGLLRCCAAARLAGECLEARRVQRGGRLAGAAAASDSGGLGARWARSRAGRSRA